MMIYHFNCMYLVSKNLLDSSAVVVSGGFAVDVEDITIAVAEILGFELRTSGSLKIKSLS